MSMVRSTSGFYFVLTQTILPFPYKYATDDDKHCRIRITYRSRFDTYDQTVTVICNDDPTQACKWNAKQDERFTTL